MSDLVHKMRTTRDQGLRSKKKLTKTINLALKYDDKGIHSFLHIRMHALQIWLVD